MDHARITKKGRELTEFDKNVFLGLLDHFVEILGYQGLDWMFIPIVWNFLREQMGLEETEQSKTATKQIAGGRTFSFLSK